MDYVLINETKIYIYHFVCACTCVCVLVYNIMSAKVSILYYKTIDNVNCYVITTGWVTATKSSDSQRQEDRRDEILSLLCSKRVSLMYLSC